MMAEAMGRALEARDAELSAGRPAGLRLRDLRERTLATEVGDVSFSRRRYRDGSGGAVCSQMNIDTFGGRIST